MPSGSIQGAEHGAVWGALASLIDADGSARAGAAGRLARRDAPVRDLIDAVHCLCLLHGRYPGIIDSAAARATDPVARGWLAGAGNGFAEERALLVRLVSAAGPLPSTPGQAESEAAIASQRHALEMLAVSERPGCAMGAAMAMVLEWGAIRGVLDAAARRMGMEIPESELPAIDESATVLDALAADARFERAALFGARQLLVQHRGLWDLLVARAAARRR